MGRGGKKWQAMFFNKVTLVTLQGGLIFNEVALGDIVFLVALNQYFCYFSALDLDKPTSCKQFG